MIKKLTFIILIAILQGCSNPDWVDFEYAYAKAYYKKDATYNDFIVDGKLNPDLKDAVSVKLSLMQILELNELMTESDGFVINPMYKCYDPRHGVVFWNHKNQPIAHVTVCFECHQLSAYPYSDKDDLEGLKKYFEKIFPEKK